MSGGISGDVYISGSCHVGCGVCFFLFLVGH